MPKLTKRKYKKSDVEYMKMYGISSSSAWRYRKENAPLDDPERFRQWIESRPHKPLAFKMPGGAKGHRVTQHIRRKVMNPVVDAADETPRREKRVTIEGTGLRVEIARQEAECAQAYKRYKEAEENDDPLGSLSFHKIWVAAQKSLRELSKDVPRSELDDSKVISISDVESSWTVALKEINTQMNSVAATVALGLVGVEPEVRLQVESAIEAEIAGVVGNFQEAPWLKK